MRQNRRVAQLGQPADFGRPSFVAFDAGISGGRAGDCRGQFCYVLRRHRIRAIQDRHGRSFRPRPGFRLIIENMPYGSTAHEVLAVVFQVRGLGSGPKTQKPQLSVLLWQRARDPQRGAWSLPGGQLRDDEDMTTSVRRQLAEKVDLREVAHLEQLAVFSDPDRVPGTRMIASTFLGLVPSPAIPELPPDTRWHPVNSLPPMVF